MPRPPSWHYRGSCKPPRWRRDDDRRFPWTGSVEWRRTGRPASQGFADDFVHTLVGATLDALHQADDDGVIGNQSLEFDECHSRELRGDGHDYDVRVLDGFGAIPSGGHVVRQLFDGRQAHGVVVVIANALDNLLLLGPHGHRVLPASASTWPKAVPRNPAPRTVIFLPISNSYLRLSPGFIGTILCHATRLGSPYGNRCGYASAGNGPPAPGQGLRLILR